MTIQGFGKMFQSPDEELFAVPTPENFTRVVDTLVQRYRITYFDAIMSLCDYYERDYDSVKSLLTPKLKHALLEEASHTRRLKDNTYLLHKLG